MPIKIDEIPTMERNIQNRTIFCHDNLEILQGINSSCVDLIYLDPPFNTNKKFSAPIGSSAEGADFPDIFREKDVKDEWLQSIKEDYDGLYQFLDGVKNLSNIVSDRKNKHYLYNYCYLSYMAIRLIECHRILKDTGSIYLHCDNTMGHYLKILLDIIFGEKNFRNSIIWYYSDTPGRPKKDFSRKHDIVLRYSKTDVFCFDRESVAIPIKKESVERYKYKRKLGGKSYLGGSLFKNPDDVWSISSIKKNTKQSTGYPTQKPLKLLERIIKASSNEGDFVLDPFCGCATTCVAAEKLGRKWAGIDVSYKAYELVKQRIKNEVLGKIDYDNNTSKSIEINDTTTPPKRTDSGANYQIKKWVYVISNPSFKNMYKVGIATNWKTRLNSYQTSDPKRAYHLEHKKETPDFRALEKHIHENFESNHEWVSGDLKEIITAIENFDANKI